jgi:hypothetical protein
MLMFAHTMIAGVTHQPMWNLSEEEAEKIANACGNVARHYDIGQTQKSIDIAALAGTLGMVYAPRVGMTIFGAKKQAESRQQEAPTILRPGNGPNGFTI